jgi:hypothetical protein
MPAFRGVEVAEGLDSAPSKSEVEDVPVFECPDIRAKIECGARKDRAHKRATQVGELDAELLVVVVILLVESQRPQRKHP